MAFNDTVARVARNGSRGKRSWLLSGMRLHCSDWPMSLVAHAIAALFFATSFPVQAQTDSGTANNPIEGLFKGHALGIRIRRMHQTEIGALVGGA